MKYSSYSFLINKCSGFEHAHPMYHSYRCCAESKLIGKNIVWSKHCSVVLIWEHLSLATV
uniref:Uncharacterized protein n=1 Tax=Anguilla anguilla TaxID=7936 RepID=A0A0E9WQI0_ANGAN